MRGAHLLRQGSAGPSARRNTRRGGDAYNDAARSCDRRTGRQECAACRGGQAIRLGELQSYLALFWFCLLASASYLFTEIYTVFKPGESQALLVRFRTWIDTHTDQAIISGNLLLAHRQQPRPDPHLRYHTSPWN